MAVAAYYNAGTATLVFLLVAVGLGTYLWYRLRKRRVQLSREAGDTEENIPLKSTTDEDVDELETEESRRRRKGKERAIDDDEGTPIFDVGEAEDE